MGRGRSRKQQRRWSQRTTDLFQPPPERETLFREAYQVVSQVHEPPPTCGGCREFFQDGVDGRGECLHPGSGVLLPWPDTFACQFYAGKR